MLDRTVGTTFVYSNVAYLQVDESEPQAWGLLTGSYSSRTLGRSADSEGRVGRLIQTILYEVGSEGLEIWRDLESYSKERCSRSPILRGDLGAKRNVQPQRVGVSCWLTHLVKFQS